MRHSHAASTGFEGEVFALAPVVPFNILVPECIFVDLKNKVTASRDESQQGKEEDERYQTQLGWLSGGKHLCSLSSQLDPSSPSISD